MLDAVLEDFLSSVTEREFDAPLVALLRAHGYRDVHLVHGQFEFGKDVIAKNEVEGVLMQYALQSKAGDIGLPQWNAMYGQIEMLRLNELSHPAFDARLPRKPVLVTTGRLIGGAPVAVQEYQRRLEGEEPPPAEVWTKDTLLELLRSAPDVGLVADAALLGVLASVDRNRASDFELETFSQRWVTPGSPTEWRTLLEAFVVIERLRKSSRLDLACMTTLLLLRAVWASGHEREPPPIEQADLVRRHFETLGAELWADCSDDMLEPRKFIERDDGVFVTYPVRCARTIELLGLYGLLMEGEERAQVAAWVARFIEAHASCSRVLSDRWAVSLIPPTALIAAETAIVTTLLTDCTRWLGDRHQDSIGLASFSATPSEEVDYAIGAALEHVDRPRRSSSYLACVLLDLTAALGLSELYDIVINDVLAVGAIPLVPTISDDLGQYTIDNPGITYDTAPKYAESWEFGDEWRMAAHHDDDLAGLYLGRQSRPWDWIAIGVALRDRHWVAAIRELARPRV